MYAIRLSLCRQGPWLARTNVEIGDQAQPIGGLSLSVHSFIALLTLASSVATTAAAGAKTSKCAGTRVAIDTSVLGTPFANLTLGGNSGSFLIDTGATYSRVDMRRYGLSEGWKIFLSGFSLPWCKAVHSSRQILVLLAFR